MDEEDYRIAFDQLVELIRNHGTFDGAEIELTAEPAPAKGKRTAPAQDLTPSAELVKKHEDLIEQLARHFEFRSNFEEILSFLRLERKCDELKPVSFDAFIKMFRRDFEEVVAKSAADPPPSYMNSDDSVFDSADAGSEFESVDAGSELESDYCGDTSSSDHERDASPVRRKEKVASRSSAPPTRRPPIPAIVPRVPLWEQSTSFSEDEKDAVTLESAPDESIKPTQRYKV